MLCIPCRDERSHCPEELALLEAVQNDVVSHRSLFSALKLFRKESCRNLRSEFVGKDK